MDYPADERKFWYVQFVQCARGARGKVQLLRLCTISGNARVEAQFATPKADGFWKSGIPGDGQNHGRCGIRLAQKLHANAGWIQRQPVCHQWPSVLPRKELDQESMEYPGCNSEWQTRPAFFPQRKISF